MTADLERGYGDEPRDVAETIAMAIDAGAVGANLEDGTADSDRPLAAVASHARKVRVVRGRADAEGVPFVINARTDVFLRGAGGVDEALERGRAYAEAGADCIFVPGVRDPEVIAALVAGLPIGMSVLATPAGPTLEELARLGVARISLGPGSMGAALAALQRAAESVLARGELPADLAFRPGDMTLQRWTTSSSSSRTSRPPWRSSPSSAWSWRARRRTRGLGWIASSGSTTSGPTSP